VLCRIHKTYLIKRQNYCLYQKVRFLAALSRDLFEDLIIFLKQSKVKRRGERTGREGGRQGGREGGRDGGDVQREGKGM